MARILLHGDSVHAATGFARVCRTLARALTGHDVTQVGVNHPMPWPARGADDLQHVWTIPASSGGSLLGEGFLSDAPAGRFDLIVIVQDVHVATHQLLPALDPRAPPVLFYFVVDSASVPKVDLGMIRRAEIAVSATVCGARAVMGAGRALDVVPHGIDVRRFRLLSESRRRAARREFFGAAPGPCLVAVGVQHERKNWYRLLEAVQRTPDARLVARTTRLSPTDEFADIAHCISSLGLDRRVRVIESKLTDADLCRLYGAADVFVSASLKEGWCLPVFEALACGTPIAAPALPALTETLADFPGVHLAPTGQRRWLAGDHRGPGTDVSVAALVRCIQAAVHDRAPDRAARTRAAVMRYAEPGVVETWRAAFNGLLARIAA